MIPVTERLRIPQITERTPMITKIMTQIRLRIEQRVRQGIIPARMAQVPLLPMERIPQIMEQTVPAKRMEIPHRAETISQETVPVHPRTIFRDLLPVHLRRKIPRRQILPHPHPVQNFPHRNTAQMLRFLPFRQMTP